ncbi:9-cis-epoxycarotenoid dioxygenase [Amycolatopsis rubida]|uniref:Dioxygenase n=1 Tax=Amycolatopsis rubida TaxID=112413 RepID=A0ABX0BMB5_9PSEU|nr:MULTISPECIES: carotenoid oxygenase family protein [Amycolatopsis]MYW89505.1 9-cis-epoxycarotenoid dioxygenase [Amycolatopsis rubida]NEC54482.1 9-cis-epoxycarotenoid dioxygenase [Amycolatopsis rubida]OAP25248.1 Carotenoid cleavage oxygenase [Amycolatopsis sp. M39]
MATTDFHLKGHYAPVHDELTARDLPVTGALPPELTGWYLRNGPNPRQDSAHWFTGDGMVHGVRLENGRAAWYRNRWVRTESFDIPDPVLYNADGTRNLRSSVANTHVVTHAGRTLTLVESSLPYEITTDLDTVGVYDFGGKLADAMTAHPKICPETGELHFFGYGSITAPHVSYYRADAAGELVLRQPIDVPGLTMMHDFALTRRHVVFFDLPVVFDHGTDGGIPYRWSDTYGARLGLLSRDRPEDGVRWFGIDPCYVFHTLNAHDTADGRIVVHVVRYEHLSKPRVPDPKGVLWRWTIDPRRGTVAEDPLDDRDGEFPRVDDRLAGLDARFGHVTGRHGPAGPLVLRRYDLHTNASREHLFPEGHVPGEAVFVPADDRPDGAGWLLAYVYDGPNDRSDLVVLDAQDLEADPVATVRLPGRVPAGFHGNWLPDA